MWWIPYIYGKHSFIVEGTPIIDPALVKQGEELADYTICFLDKDGNINKRIELTEYQLAIAKKAIMRNPKRYLKSTL